MAKTAAIMESFAPRQEKVKKDPKSWPHPDFQQMDSNLSL